MLYCLSIMHVYYNYVKLKCENYVTLNYENYLREMKKYQWDIQGKGKSTITDKLRRTARTRQKQHRHNIKN